MDEFLNKHIQEIIANDSKSQLNFSTALTFDNLDWFSPDELFDGNPESEVGFKIHCM